ncbi:hypothetical protein L208DRAFT_1246651 [Tricholoma matsutake]|nr:hypothetical protein L208DRAFT_1246651 [Tricholoma matsutake 945]
MNNQQPTQADGIPDGYVHIRSDNGQHYLVPHFMIPATHQAMEAYHKKVKFNVCNADRGVSFHPFQSAYDVNATLMLWQKLTDRELLSCHAGVNALQNQLGTLYKDASHYLYMAKVEKLEQQDITWKTYATLKARVEQNLKSFGSWFSEITSTLQSPTCPSGL